MQTLLFQDCSPGWSRYDSICFISSVTPALNWTDARMFCHSQHSSLPSANSSSEQLSALLKHSKSGTIWLDEDLQSPRERIRRIIKLEPDESIFGCSAYRNDSLIDNIPCQLKTDTVCVKPREKMQKMK